MRSDEVFRLFSAERLTPYLDATGGDRGAAITLYRWNARVAAQMSVCIGHSEVLLRNALSAQLTKLSPSEPWYLGLGPVLDTRAKEDIAAARRRAVRNGRDESTGRVIAELSFGFWRYLVSPRYHRTLWMPGMLHALPGMKLSLRRGGALVGEVHELRNRISHQEPIHGLDLREKHIQILRLVGWIDSSAPAWVESDCGVATLLEVAPRGSRSSEAHVDRPAGVHAASARRIGM